MFRIGQGFDVHRLSEGYTLTLGGVKVPHHRGLVGHSDADVLLHAISDALLGAADLRDIGFHFSDQDPQYRGIDSRILLEKVGQLLHAKGFSIVNIDSTLCLQEPRISSYLPAMKEEISRVLGLAESQVSVKATTTERLGFEGREEGISALAIALIQSSIS